FLSLWKSRLQNFLFELSNDLFAFPPIDLFSAAVPKLNSSFQIPDENRIVSKLKKIMLPFQSGELIRFFRDVLDGEKNQRVSRLGLYAPRVQGHEPLAHAWRIVLQLKIVNS